MQCPCGQCCTMGWASVPERYDGGDAGRNQEEKAVKLAFQMVSAMWKYGIERNKILQMLCGQFAISEEEAEQYLNQEK